MVEMSQLGIIGNCCSAVLITKNGAIVWNCLPDFDSASVFAGLLDGENGGVLGIVPESNTAITQSYIERTNILCTRFVSVSGSFEVLDFRPVYALEEKINYQAPEIYRLIQVSSGNPSIKIRYQPKLNYPMGKTNFFIQEESIKSIMVKGEHHSIYLYSNLPLADILAQQPIVLTENAFLLVSYHQKLIPIDVDSVNLELDRTKLYWLNWVSRTKTYPLYQKAITRSTLNLKQLTYQRTGAAVAAVCHDPQSRQPADSMESGLKESC